MKSKTRVSKSALIWVSLGVLLVSLAACSESEAEAAASPGSLVDLPLSGHQGELLDLAFEAASNFPLDPHSKNRSRAQAAVVQASLELDQPRAALTYIEGITGWRRSAGYADLAFYCAERGLLADAEDFLLLAGQHADGVAMEESDQAWRRDQVRAKIARTHLLMGDAEKARELEAGIAVSELGRVRALRATLAEESDYDAELSALDPRIATGDFDELRTALETAAELFNSFYLDERRRAQVEERIDAAQVKLPHQIRIELMTELAGFALGHSDTKKALQLLEEAGALLDGGRWAPEDRIPMLAALSAMRFRAGDESRARSAVDRALSMFDTERDLIVNIYRAAALRPIAEAYVSMGDHDAARAVYERALEAGVENPNSRPRAEDLSATCVSMARLGFEPDAALRERMRQICDGLGDPW